MNNAATEQDLPVAINDLTVRSVQDEMWIRCGGGIGGDVIRDALLRAERAKTKYKLDRAGCFAFNGRDAILDAYQEIVDCLVYLTQYDMERQMLNEKSFLPPFFEITMLGMAMTLRQHLVDQGDFE